jgi:hypothetical protein
MYRLFYKYKPVIISGFILISLIAANFTSAVLRDFFLGLATGAALVNFGQSLGEIKAKKKINHCDEQLVGE